MLTNLLDFYENVIESTKAVLRFTKAVLPRVSVNTQSAALSGHKWSLHKLVLFTWFNDVFD